LGDVVEIGFVGIVWNMDGIIIGWFVSGLLCDEEREDLITFFVGGL
jgi:hypothetical protein